MIYAPLNGKCLISCCTEASVISRPISRLASKTIIYKRQSVNEVNLNHLKNLPVFSGFDVN